MKRVLIVFVVLAASVSAYAQTGLAALEREVTALVERVTPWLVTVEGQASVGTGIVMSVDGDILTAYSVVGPSGTATIHFSDGATEIGEVVGTDPETNLAVVRVGKRGLRTARFGDSSRLKSGSWVAVVGDALGVNPTVALGTVSGVRDNGFLQMSVTTAPGAAGGAVLNTSGELVGLVFAKVSEPIQVFGFQNRGTIELPTTGLSLAIPVNYARQVYKTIRTGERVKRGYLGVRVQTLTGDLARHFDTSEGALVSDVVDGGPADVAGIVQSDIIVSVSGEAVSGPERLRTLMAEHKPDETVNVELIREGGKHKVRVTLGERPEEIAEAFLRRFEVHVPEAPPVPDLPGVPPVPGSFDRGRWESWGKEVGRSWGEWGRRFAELWKHFADSVRVDIDVETDTANAHIFRFRVDDTLPDTVAIRKQIELQLRDLEQQLRQLQEQLEKLKEQG
jgi:S1-C subfamily serine protease